MIQSDNKLEKSERAEASNAAIRTQTAKAAQSLPEAIQASHKQN